LVKKYETLAIIPILAVVYFCAAKVGLRFAFVHPSATALWALTGITLAAFLIFGLRVWPGIFLGAFLVNLSTVGTALTSIGIATGNTLEGVVGCYLINRFSRGQHTFDREQDIFKFALLAGVVSTTIPAHVEGGWAPRSGSARARSQPGLSTTGAARARATNRAGHGRGEGFFLQTYRAGV